MENHTKPPQFRPVNRILGDQPRIGPIPAEQAVPWAVIAAIVYLICKGVFGMPLLWTILLMAWGIATWWTLTGRKSWKYLAKFVPVPKAVTRGHAAYLSLLDTAWRPNERQFNSQTPGRQPKTGVRNSHKTGAAKRQVR